MEKAISKLAEALKAASAGRQTIDLITIRSCFYSVRPELKNDVSSRRRMAADLQSLAEHEIISLPASKSSFDCTALPPVPNFIRLIYKASEPGPEFDHRTFAWSIPMSFVAGLARLPNIHIAQRLNDFFRANWESRPLVPVKERSYELFGNEKLLEKVLEGQFGYDGRLTLEMLRCYRVP